MEVWPKKAPFREGGAFSLFSGTSPSWWLQEVSIRLWYLGPLYLVTAQPNPLVLLLWCTTHVAFGKLILPCLHIKLKD